MRTVTVPLSCPVRGCALPLEHADHAWTCVRGHAFDVARSGYVNLLQPQDRRSPDAGDARASIEARARLLAAGIGASIVNAFVSRAAALIPNEAVVTDLGCGSGDVLGSLVQARAVTAIGIDLSAFAIDRAARRFPGAAWVVANADRRLPLLDASVSLVLSLNSRRNVAECARVLVPGGHLLVGVPAPDDLVELRAAVQGQRVERDRLENVIAEHASRFDIVDRTTARERQELTAEQLHDILKGTYRGIRTSAAGRVEALDAMEVTFASDVVVLRRSGDAGAAV
jgi:23S rRNA (guanine745-N1)-methyltransferase